MRKNDIVIAGMRVGLLICPTTWAPTPSSTASWPSALTDAGPVVRYEFDLRNCEDCDVFKPKRNRDTDSQS
jgi:hypothetical protein